jgi:hypothetical protein
LGVAPKSQSQFFQHARLKSLQRAYGGGCLVVITLLSADDLGYPFNLS